MILENSYKRKEEIYINHLKEIANLKFTLREIDITACIVNGNNVKKTASMLSISHRTVETHIFNIMKRSGCNSREHLIEFIKKSEKLEFIKKYYIHLLIQLEFYNCLSKVTKVISKQPHTCFLYYLEIDDEEEKMLKRLIEDLKLANIIIRITKEVEKKEHKLESYLCVLSSNLLEPAELKGAIILVFKQGLNINIKDNIEYLDFRQKSYYFLVLELIKKILGTSETLAEITNEFGIKYQFILNSLKYLEKPTNETREVSKISVSLSKKILTKQQFIFITATLIISVLILIVFGTYKTFLPMITSNNEVQQQKPKLDNILSLIKNHSLSSDNITEKQMQQNQSAIKQMETVLEAINNSEIEAYFRNNKLISQELVSYLHILHSIASYYNYNEHNGAKAYKILNYAKNLAENYVTSRSKVPLNWKDLSNEELFTELSIIKDLPEIYTKLIYLLGRTYIYQKDRQSDGLRYFELSKYLGNKLGLFEGYLSVRSGSGILIECNIDKDIKAGNHKEAKEKLITIIGIYKQLRNDDKQYIVDYKPHTENQQIIDPKKDVYNQIDCAQQVAKYYAKLIRLSYNINEKAEYANELLIHFVGKEKVIGILELLQEVTNKKKASVYNSLGNALLQLHDNKIKLGVFNTKLISLLNLTEGDELKIIEQIFNLAKSHSRNTDYTKADSYDGLIKVYQRQIKQKHLQNEDKNDFLTKIKELEKKRDDLNDIFNR